MTHEQATNQIMAEYAGKRYLRGKADCATLCADYIGHRTGSRPSFRDLGKPPTRGQVRDALGKPTDAVGAGCVVLMEDASLGIHLGYCILTMIEGQGLARTEADGIKAGWEV